MNNDDEVFRQVIREGYGDHDTRLENIKAGWSVLLEHMDAFTLDEFMAGRAALILTVNGAVVERITPE